MRFCKLSIKLIDILLDYKLKYSKDEYEYLKMIDKTRSSSSTPSLTGNAACGMGLSNFVD